MYVYETCMCVYFCINVYNNNARLRSVRYNNYIDASIFRNGLKKKAIMMFEF